MCSMCNWMQSCDNLTAEELVAKGKKKPQRPRSRNTITYYGPGEEQAVFSLPTRTSRIVRPMRSWR